VSQDEEHLKLLSIFHYVVGGLAGLFACFPVIHLIMGIVMLAGGFQDSSGQGPPKCFGLIFVMMALLFISVGWSLAVCLIISGRQLAKRRRYKFSFIIACISCMFMPFGIVLGVFTIIVLMRPSIRELFEANKNMSAVSSGD